MRYKFLGHVDETFPTLGRVLHPGQVIEVADEIEHTRLAATDEPVTPEVSPVEVTVVDDSDDEPVTAPNSRRSRPGSTQE